MKINKSILNLKPYKLTSHKAWENSQDLDILKLDWNESTIPPSPKVLNAIKNYLNGSRLNWYPDTNNGKLLSAFANYANVSLNNIDYYASSDCLQEYLARLLIENNDTVLILGPTYDNFRVLAESFGANTHILNANKDNNFQPPFDLLEKKLDLLKPNVAYICNPNNPTGQIISPEKIVNLAKSFPKTAFIIDEAYFEFASVTCSDRVNSFRNIIISRTLSKAFGLASVRIGYVIANEYVIQMLKKIKNHKSISSFAQITALAALSDLDYVDKYKKNVSKGKRFFCNWLESKNYQHTIGEGNFVLVDFLENKDEIVEFLRLNNIFLRKYDHVSGMNSFVRVTIGTEEMMVRLTEKIDQFFQSE